jgi:hypothetical protein
MQTSFTCRKSTTWDRRLYFPSEGRRAGDFFSMKNPTVSAGFEPANLGTRGQHASSRPPKPLKMNVLKRVLIEKATCTRKWCNETMGLSYSHLKGDWFIGREKHSLFEKQCCGHILWKLVWKQFKFFSQMLSVFRTSRGSSGLVRYLGRSRAPTIWLVKSQIH